MKFSAKHRWLIALFIVVANSQMLFAQLAKSNIFDEKTPITWFGLDFSQTKFIGSATNTSVSVSPWGIPNSKDNGPITNDDFRNTYTLAWNQLFIDEEKKYNIAKAVHRESVKYALDVTTKNNKALTKKDFFSNNPSDFKTINENTISSVVKSYDFGNNDGLGLIYFVEGMSKGIESAGVWVTFVDIKTKTVLYTTYLTGKPGGFGFRNFWAKTFLLVTKEIESNFKKWKN